MPSDGAFNRREFLALGAVGAFALQGAPRRPNMVMIYCDDLGYSDLGCYGNRMIRTPNLDQLAARGTRFTSFYSTSPVCSPARAALLTGHYPQCYGIHHADLPESLPRYFLPESAVTIAEVLQQAGYYTAHVGKWHVGEPPDTVPPRQHGFDYFFGCFGGRPSSPWSRYARSMDPEIIINENRPVVYKGHVTEVETRAAREVIAGAKRDRPFFLALFYNAPHEPLAPLANQAKLYRDWSSEEQTYFQTVTDMDAGVGQVLTQLREAGLENDTLVVFSSDNGPETHSHRYSRGSAWPRRGMKTQLWEGGVRVPGIVCWPGRVPAGKVSDEPASILDVFPTFSAAAGVPPPKGLTLDGGVDLAALANGKLSTAARPLFFEFHFPQRGYVPSLPMAVRKGRWKLFAQHDLSVVELYDLETGIGEQNDVAGQHPEVVRELREELRRWWAQFADQVDLTLKPVRVETPGPEQLERKYYRN